LLPEEEELLLLSSVEEEELDLPVLLSVEEEELPVLLSVEELLLSVEEEESVWTESSRSRPTTDGFLRLAAKEGSAPYARKATAVARIKETPKSFIVNF